MEVNDILKWLLKYFANDISKKLKGDKVGFCIQIERNFSLTLALK